MGAIWFPNPLSQLSSNSLYLFLAHCGKGELPSLEILFRKNPELLQDIYLYIWKDSTAASGVSTISQPHFVASEEGHFDPGQVLEILILASLVKKIRTWQVKKWNTIWN